MQFIILKYDKSDYYTFSHDKYQERYVPLICPFHCGLPILGICAHPIELLKW